MSQSLKTGAHEKDEWISSKQWKGINYDIFKSNEGGFYISRSGIHFETNKFSTPWNCICYIEDY